MKDKKVWFCIVLTLAALITPLWGDPCASSCVSTDPVEVAECLLECEE